jgi:hypothetical protein
MCNTIEVEKTGLIRLVLLDHLEYLFIILTCLAFHCMNMPAS